MYGQKQLTHGNNLWGLQKCTVFKITKKGHTKTLKIIPSRTGKKLWRSHSAIWERSHRCKILMSSHSVGWLRDMSYYKIAGCLYNILPVLLTLVVSGIVVKNINKTSFNCILEIEYLGR